MSSKYCSTAEIYLPPDISNGTVDSIFIDPTGAHILVTARSGTGDALVFYLSETAATLKSLPELTVKLRSDTINVIRPLCRDTV